ncbi:MAG: cellulase family glycosylhydrolase [Clostridia bacterium]|nr:cellulase family glycosylhydrolase [Clostridia bacterium]
MKRKWTESEAWAWQEKVGWLRGCNFIGSDCAGRVDMWQSYKNDEHMKTAERELALCRDTGFNTVRIIIEFDVWLQEHDSFMRIFEKYIELCAKYDLMVMVVLANEAQLCRGDRYVPKRLGEQAYALGYHQGRLPITPEQKALVPYHELERDETRDKYVEMVKEIVGKYRDDNRIICWNVFNEPGITVGEERSLPLIRLMFDTVRALDPVQPLASDVWWWGNPDSIRPFDKLSLELSDVISWHCYKPFEQFVVDYERLTHFNRPILLTEWLHRINRQKVRDVYPLLYLEKINCWCWGFVAGKTQTYEPWDSLWEQYDKTDGKVDYDFTCWQHDLYRPSLRPYDPEEIRLIKRFNELAEERQGKQ